MGEIHEPYGASVRVLTKDVSSTKVYKSGFPVYLIPSHESFEKLLSQPRKGFTRLMQPRDLRTSLVSARR